MKYITLILAATTLFSCTESATIKTNDNVAIEQETPQVLNEKDYDIESSWSSKRYNNNIVDKLFKEALENNNELAALNKKFNVAIGYKNDSLEVYNQYINTNSAYWNDVSNYIHQIKDSILMKKTEKEFETLKIAYKKSITTHKKKIKLITEKSEQLKDQLPLLKLKVTTPMMKNYQKNELPLQQPLEHLIIDYDSLIKESEAFMKKNKS